MSLAAGTRVGPYEIVGPVGEGGMGVVYRARDVRLGRDVALKTLPREVATDSERLARFAQEARAAGALNHPNILMVLDAGEHDGAPFVVYELLEGRTLRDELANGPLSVRRTIDYAVQVASGLSAAHTRRIVHRDLKPENLFITRDGHVKILDFGIAKLLERPGPDASAATATAGGMILGTAGYMSPEQIRAERTDERSDIFSLGCVLYEMVAGDRAFKRSTAVETMNAILTAEPPEIASPSGAAPALDRIVRHCLEKDPAARFQSARDVAFALEGLHSTSGSSARVEAGPVAQRSLARSLGWAIGALLVLGAVAYAAYGWRRPDRAAPRPIRFEVAAPEGGAFQGILGVSSAISPDGQHLAMAVTTSTGPRLFVRHLNSTRAEQIAGTEGAFNPFWSPDSRQIGFFTAGKLKTVALDGGAPRTLCDAEPGPWLVGTWGEGNRILFTGGDMTGPSNNIHQVVGGQKLEPVLTSSAQVILAWPHFLPDGKHFLVYVVAGSGSDNEIRIATLGSQETTLLLRVNSRAVYADPGYLLYVREGTLFAHPFDATRRQLTGDPFPVAENLLYFRNLGQADFSVSRNGVLAYQAGPTMTRLSWMDRKGTELGQLGKADAYYFLDLSPDGKKVAVDILDRVTGATDVWVFDERSAEPTRFTNDPFIDWTPVFSPDSSRLAFASARRGAPHLHMKALTDSGQGEMLEEPTGQVQFASEWAKTPRGEVILYNGTPAPSKTYDIWARPLTGDAKPRPILQNSLPVYDGRLSPDGRWLAYGSLESGRSEVYVRALEGSTERWPVSSGGGVSPRWTREGRELIYLATASSGRFGSTATSGRLMSVAITPGPPFAPGVPQPLFNVIANNGQYDVTANGERFLVNLGAGSAALPITVATDWLSGAGR